MLVGYHGSYRQGCPRDPISMNHQRLIFSIFCGGYVLDGEVIKTTARILQWVPNTSGSNERRVYPLFSDVYLRVWAIRLLLPRFQLL